MVGVLGAIVAIEEVLVAFPQISNSVTELFALAKRGLSGGPDPTPEEIEAAREHTREGLAQLQRDIDEG